MCNGYQTSGSIVGLSGSVTCVSEEPSVKTSECEWIKGIWLYAVLLALRVLARELVQHRPTRLV